MGLGLYGSISICDKKKFQKVSRNFGNRWFLKEQEDVTFEYKL